MGDVGPCTLLTTNSVVGVVQPGRIHDIKFWGLKVSGGETEERVDEGRMGHIRVR